MHIVSNSFIQHLFEMRLSQLLDKNCYFMSTDEDVRNRFKGLDLINCLMNYGWRFVTLYRGQESRPSPRKEMQKGKMVI